MIIDRRLLRNIDWSLVIITLLLIVVGLVMVYGTTRGNVALTQGDQLSVVKRQIIAALIGFLLIVAVMSFDYHISDRAYMALYVINILMLITVLVFGVERNGAKSWLNLGMSFQPSEMAKVFLILTLARHLSKKESLSTFYDLISAFVHVGIPLFLIMLQPDLGTMLVFIAILFGMLFFAGAKPRHLGAIILVVVVVVTVWALLHVYLDVPFFLKEYQINRLTVFINPERDSRGAGYNVIQAMTAVGSGRFLGKGVFHSTQGRLGFLPEHHTDFIFAIFGEEFGFIGSFLLLCGFFFLMWRGLKIAMAAKDKYASLVAGGVVCMFAFHLLVNVGMNIGIMPITGIPLPFISVGGSSMMASLMAVGLLLNIWARRLKIMF